MKRGRFWVLVLCTLAALGPARLPASVVGVSGEFPGEMLPVPDHIVEKARAYLVSRLGSEFVSDHITYLPDRSHTMIPRDERYPGWPGWHVVRFRLWIEDRPFVDWNLNIRMEMDGVYRSDDGGIPWCTRWPTECEFPIDEQRAKQIAEELGLEPGLREWHVVFTWESESGFTWRISNVTHRAANDQPGGFVVVIDANTGRWIEGPRQWGRWPKHDDDPIAPN